MSEPELNASMLVVTCGIACAAMCAVSAARTEPNEWGRRLIYIVAIFAWSFLASSTIYESIKKLSDHTEAHTK